MLVSAPGPRVCCPAMAKPESLLRILRFAVVGGVVTGAFIGLNGLFGRWLGADLAFLAAYPPAVGLHFCLNKWWTFGDRSAVRTRQLSGYALLMVVAFLIQAAVFKALTHFAGSPGWLASGIATVAQMALSFLLMHRRIFVAAGPGMRRPRSAGDGNLAEGERRNLGS